MSPTTLALFLVFIIGTATDVAPAAKEVQFFTSSQEQEKSLFFTVEGCNNDCETACCDCNIKKHPPVCVKCCRI
ncbi:hypothetical protein AALP_AA5G042800 [Arabis alpina]|uniref:Embryo surrounding factor 1 brassicaceae domain-containing protein n=1 Tax=Arabis alpina TaxID=50452 RepID=A0A087GUV9_ARAAL|nr:hypothetical protein AALP_AA5G042800 [Arabis alpina]